MIIKRYIFSGLGYAVGDFEVSNHFISDAIEKGFLRGFDVKRMAKNREFIAYKEQHPDAEPFDFFVKEKMGFETRKHVTPFPPTPKKLYYAKSSLDLGVEACYKAIKEAGISPKEIDAWFFSTVSPHQKAPGIAAAIKAHFVDFRDKTPAFTLTSGCSGFNVNLERALHYFKAHPEAKHVIVGHAETMSSFLTQRIKFTPFVTFADGSGVVVLSRIETDQEVGVMAINNFHDTEMINDVGVDIHWNLYMSDGKIKDRAVIDIPAAAIAALKASDWSPDEVDYCIPHQTGNVILYEAAKMIGLPNEKVYLEGQHKYGNISGATVPVSLALFKEDGLMIAGQKLVCPMAGVGGGYGAFTYIVPEEQPIEERKTSIFAGDLKGKKAIVLGASGTLGLQVVKVLAERGASLLLHYHKSENKIPELQAIVAQYGVEASFLQADFNDNESVDSFIDTLQQQDTIDYFVNAAGVLLSRREEKVFRVNYMTPLRIFKALFTRIKQTALFVGAAAEDCTVAEIDEFISAKNALHGTLASLSGEVYKAGFQVCWYMPGVLNSGFLHNIDKKTLYKFMLSIDQSKPLEVAKVAERIVHSLYMNKVAGTYNKIENALIVRRDGYQIQTDV